MSNSALIFLIRFFPTLANVLVIILFSRNFDTSFYGSYQNFWVHLVLLSSLATIGIPALLLTYSPAFIRQLANGWKRRYYVMLFTWICFLALVYSWLRVEETGISWHVPFGLFIVYTLNAIAESLVIVLKRFGVLLWVNVFYTITFILLHCAVLTGHMTLEPLFFFVFVAGLVKLLVTGSRAYHLLRQIPVTGQYEYKMSDVRSLWLHIGFYDVFQKVFTWIDKFIVSLLFSLSVSGIYFNATIDIPFLPLLLGAVSGAALMQLANSPKKRDKAEAIQVANQSARLLSAVVFPLFFFLYFFRHELFTVVLTPKYADSIPIFAATVFVVPLRAYNFTTILQNRHKGRIINAGALLDISVAGLVMYPLYLLWGLTGIAASFVVSSYVQGAFYLYHSAKVLHVSPLQLIPVRNWLVKLIVFGTLFIVIHYLAGQIFAAVIVLFLGILAMVLSLAVALLIEFRAAKKQYVQPVSQEQK